MKFAVNINRYSKYGYQDKVVVEATVDAENPRAALQDVLDNWALGYDCPREIETVFEETADDLHAVNGDFSYDVCKW